MVGPALADTGGHALGGWLVAAGIDIAADTLAGLGDEIRAALQPVAIVFLGLPSIARVVMALLRFGGGLALVFTIAVATGPLILAAAVEGRARSMAG